MRTEKQRETSKINGANSHGPTTEAGKDASKNNATRHGLASDNPIVLCNEDPSSSTTSATSSSIASNPSTASRKTSSSAWSSPLGSVRQFLAVKAISEQTSGALLQRYAIRAERLYTNALRNLQLLQGDRFNNPGHPASPGIPAPNHQSWNR